MQITSTNWSEYYRTNKDLFDFIQTAIIRLAEDSRSQNWIDYDAAFETIFQDYEEADGSYAVPADPIQGTAPFEFKGEWIDALKQYCADSLREDMDEWRRESAFGHPALTAGERNR